MPIRNVARMPVLMLLVALTAFAGWGCSSGVSTSGLSLVTPQGDHPPGWVAAHPSSAWPNGGTCKLCHGDNLQGGVSGVSCFSASRGTQGCHATGPAFHPSNWLDKLGGNFHGAAYDNGVLINDLACTDCHDPANPLDPPGFICLDCHFTIDGQRVPSGSAYNHGQVTGHSAFLPDNAVNIVCQRCHETNNTFGHMPQPFCHNCHEPFPTAFHPTGWANPAAHGTAAKGSPGVQTGFDFCRSCHGANFTGSGNAPSCLNNVFCHGSGVVSPHTPSPWRAPMTARTHTSTATGNAPVCGLCHLGGGRIVIIPPSPVPPGVTPGCFNGTLCHGQVTGAPHPVRPFTDHPSRAKSEFSTFCKDCHPILPPRILPAAPACTECHTGGNPLQVTNCATCHGNPPNGQSPVGNVFPNIEGAHAEHNALDNVAGDCGTCHNGGGTGTGTEHFYDGAVDVGFRNLVYKARGGNLLFNSTDNTCTNVSCHGGIRTPNWRTGTIDVNTDAGCVQCHAYGISEFNSFFSGEHDLHVNRRRFGCRECHNMALQTAGALNHFRFLNTPEMEGPASGTFQNSTGTVVYNPSTQRCTGICHSKNHTNDRW